MARWAWRRREEAPLLLTPISATVRSDDMRMALTIGALPHAALLRCLFYARSQKGSATVPSSTGYLSVYLCKCQSASYMLKGLRCKCAWQSFA